jgi:hypothetical protein
VLLEGESLFNDASSIVLFEVRLRLPPVQPRAGFQITGSSGRNCLHEPPPQLTPDP